MADCPPCFMKIPLTVLAALAWLVAGQPVRAQTIDWGSEALSDLVDSSGRTLDNSYVFELGAFESGFTPTATNVNEWSAHWSTFDRAGYDGFEDVDHNGIDDNEMFGNFASSVQMQAGGHSSNPAYTNLGLDFQDLDAYLWIRNGSTPEPGTEWLLARAEEWRFPTYDNCCDDPSLIPSIQWSVSDLSNTHVTPVWGNQDGHTGAGVVTDTALHTLQTALVPEPSAAWLVALGGLAAVLRRRRPGF